MKKHRSVFCLTLVFLSLSLLSGCNRAEGFTSEGTPVQSSQISPPNLFTRTEVITIPTQAKQLLIEGNQRFASGNLLSKDFSAKRRSELAEKGQHPFAVVVSCSDSRVPPEDLFDQALGDLFVVRVAGNVITPVELGSIEYAVEHLKVPLILVLGHEKCGAVTAAVEGGELPGSIGAIVEEIRPAMGQVKETNTSKESLIQEVTELNILNSLKEIEQSPIIQHVLGESLEMNGGMYQLETGRVQWINAI